MSTKSASLLVCNPKEHMDAQSTTEKSCFSEHQNNKLLQNNISFWAPPTDLLIYLLYGAGSFLRS
jgi:hypothetical protein